MRIAACQFAVSGNISENYKEIAGALQAAKSHSAQLVVFPECALTGYPPRDIPTASCVDTGLVTGCCAELQRLAEENDISFIVGTVYEENGMRNRAILFRPDKVPKYYDKRALWGWDKENFIPGDGDGLFRIGDLSVGIRICYEVRFPEYFRELYGKADLIVVLFYDVSDQENDGRYQLIRAHLQTRAVENITPILSVNAVYPFQTAPTAVIGKSGQILKECGKGCPELLVYDLKRTEDSYSEKGRRFFSDKLTQRDV